MSLWSVSYSLMSVSHANWCKKCGLISTLVIYVAIIAFYDVLSYLYIDNTSFQHARKIALVWQQVANLVYLLI
jgi:hypothetical protein